MVGWSLCNGALLTIHQLCITEWPRKAEKEDTIHFKVTENKVHVSFGSLEKPGENDDFHFLMSVTRKGGYRTPQTILFNLRQFDAVIRGQILIDDAMLPNGYRRRICNIYPRW